MSFALLYCRFYEGAHKIGTLEKFKSLGVSPETLPAVIFASVGRTVWRDIGATAILFRVVMKWVDYNLFACIERSIATWLPDFKDASTQQSKRKAPVAGNGSKLD